MTVEGLATIVRVFLAQESWPMISPVLPVYNRSDITMVRGEGVFLWDELGKRYLDFAAGIAVNSLGHCHPYVVQELCNQAHSLWHCSNLYWTPPLKRLAERLVDNSFADTVFFTNSGTEAVECGIKMVRKYHASLGTPRPDIITVDGGFHGRTLACISASQNTRATEGYAPLLQGFSQARFGDIASLRQMITSKTGGILLETVQGEGGIRVQDKLYLQQVRALADEHGILLFLDEVQCGIGRTGTLFAFETYGIVPDICSIAKGIGTGFPLGACLATAKAASGMNKGSHGGTYGGNPLAMAVGNAVLDIILTPEFMLNVNIVGKKFHEELELIKNEFSTLALEIRGKGLMLGLKMKNSTEAMVTRLREHGLLTVASSSDNVIRFLPPLIITHEHVDMAISVLRDVMKEHI